MYCDKCKIIFDGGICPVCGTNAKGEPKADDLVFLTEKDAVWGDMFEGILKGNDISYIKKAAKGAAMALETGPLSEKYSFYIPYEKYKRAAELLNEYFK